MSSYYTSYTSFLESQALEEGQNEPEAMSIVAFVLAFDAEVLTH